MKRPMKKWVWLLIMGGLVVSCAGLPELQKTAGPETPDPGRGCLVGVYPLGNWQLLHTIEAELPGSQKGFLMGVTQLSSQKRSFRSVIMTLEGFVVFDAQYDGTIRVARAVAPFDNAAFAQGVMADIQLIFFKPMADDITIGALAGGATVCRHSLPDGSVIDVAQPKDNQWETRLYGPNHRLRRVVKRSNSQNPPMETPMGITHKIELTALGNPGYKLALDLVEAISLESGNSVIPGSE